MARPASLSVNYCVNSPLAVSVFTVSAVFTVSNEPECAECISAEGTRELATSSCKLVFSAWGLGRVGEGGGVG